MIVIHVSGKNIFEVPCLNIFPTFGTSPVLPSSHQAGISAVSVVPAKELNDTAAEEDRKDHNASLKDDL